MEVKIKQGEEMIDATIEMVDGVMVVSPKEEEYEPKDGDIVFSGVSLILIFKSLSKDYIASYVALYGSILSYKEAKWTRRNLRPATEEEKQKLFKALEDNGLSWDAEKRELVEVKWKPTVGESYYYPSISLVLYTFGVGCNLWIKDRVGKFLYEKGWAFPYTEQGKADCRKLVDKLNEAINSVEP